MSRGRKPKTADAYVEGVIAGDINRLVPHYLIACHAYYVDDEPLITDRLFDDITKRLIAAYPDITHRHKDLISLDDLKAGTGYALTYPSIVKGAVRDMREKLLKGNLK